MIALDVYRGVEARFVRNARLVAMLRRTYFGLPPDSDKEYLPHVAVTVDMVEELDTYDENIARYQVRFTLRTKHVRIEDVQRAMRHLAATYDDARYDAGGLSFGDWSRKEESSPELNDGVFETSLAYDVIVTSRMKTPYFASR